MGKRGLQKQLDAVKERVRVKLKNVGQIHIQDADKLARDGDVVELLPRSAAALMEVGLADLVEDRGKKARPRNAREPRR